MSSSLRKNSRKQDSKRAKPTARLSEVHGREDNPTTTEYVDRNTAPASLKLHDPAGLSVEQRVPMLKLPHPVGAVAKTPLPPPVDALKKSTDSVQKTQSLWTRFRGILLSKEEFMDFQGHKKGAKDITFMAAWQRGLARRLDALYIPLWSKRLAFDTVEFFTRRRVYVVLLIVMLATAVVRPTQDVLDIISSAITVSESARPGLTFLEKFNGGRRQLPRKHPVVIIPGFITGALELWEAKGTCLDRQAVTLPSSVFRQRMFGASMMFLMLTDPACWLELFSMDKVSGFDRPGVKVRADTGFTSVDYFMPGYWVWAKILINLADIGYDPQSMGVMTYDWRLSPQQMHKRDGVFYHIRNDIKFLCQRNRQRAVVISHSYGTTVALSFFKWTEQREVGFMNKYVAYYVNIGGTVMGLPKAVSSLLHGDARDTLTFPRLVRRAFEAFMAQSARYNCTRSWSCLHSMLPHGCDELPPRLWTFSNGTAMNMHEIAQLAIEECRRTGHLDCVRNVQQHLKTIDELPVLPQAPNTTAVCLYGVDKLTEMGYHIADNESESGIWKMNLSYMAENTMQGVHLGSGDGTVPLLSLGYMCRAPNGWVRNVGRVVTVEYPQHVENATTRKASSGSSADHVGILGHYGLLETLLKIASGVDAVSEKSNHTILYTDPTTNVTERLHGYVQDVILSDIDEMIRGNAQCLAKPNQPIQPGLPEPEVNEFL